MSKNISEEDVHQAIEQVMHPEISRSLVELGMVKDVTLRSDKVSLSLVLPFLGIPASVKDYLVNSVRQALANLDASSEIEINLAEMNPQERAIFLAMEQEGWIG